MISRKSAKQAYLLGLGIGLMAGAVMSYISLWFVFVLGIVLIAMGFKFKEVGKEAKDFFEVKDDD